MRKLDIAAVSLVIIGGINWGHGCVSRSRNFGVTRAHPVASDQVEYVKEASRVAGAAAIAEVTAMTGSSGLKPEGGITFQKITESIRTIALWVPATTRVIADAPQLRAYIDEYLDAD